MTEESTQLIERYFVALDVPEDEWPRQREKLSKMKEEDLQREVEALERIFDNAASEIVAGRDLWAREEAQRRKLIWADFSQATEWLASALVKATALDVDSFAPFQDQIDPKYLVDDLHRFYLSIPRDRRATWTEVFVDLASEALLESISNSVTAQLLQLIDRIDALAALAANSRLAPNILYAHRLGHLDIPVRLLLKIFATACTKSSESWVRLTRLVDFDFKQAIESNLLTEGDFKKLGKNIAASMQRSDLLARIGTLRVGGWRALAFSSFVPELPVAGMQVYAPTGICVQGFDYARTEQKISSMLELVN
jgi:hypothetical protein